MARRISAVNACLLNLLFACVFLFSISPANAFGEFTLSKKVIVQYDKYGVPHITAANDADLYFAQGYVCARDRLWQMEFDRRSASGRLAEILGKDYIDQDEEMCRIGLYRAAVATYESLSEDMKMLAAAYAAGVNHYINSNLDNLPREFRHLNFKPEPWRPADSIVIPLTMFWSLSGTMEEELMLLHLVDEIGSDSALELVSGQPADPETHILWKQASALIPEGFGRDGFKILSNLERFSGPPGAMRFLGSNNWVIHGLKSESGVPILANDPHLSLTNPSVWYEVHLSGPGINVIGSTFPGVPGVVIGHNEHIAWGVTNVGYDVCDLYIEKLSSDDPNRYIYKTESTPFKKVVEKIKYIDGNEMKEVEREIKFTVHGPVIYEGDGAVISMRWTGHEPSTEFRFIYLVDRASDVEGFRTALSYYRIAAQNFIYADTDGNIFYQPTGKVPIRNGAPFLPLDGSSGACEWESYIPYDELPRVLNPDERYIATANARPVDTSYPYYIGYFFDIGYRVRRIKDLLMAKDKLSFEDVRAIQADNYVMAAERLKPILLKAVAMESPLVSGRTLEAAKIIEEWDNHATTDSVACTIFNKWLERIAANTLQDDLSKESFDYWAGNPDIIVVLLARSESMEGLQNDWFDNRYTPMPETREQVIARSLQQVVDQLGFKYGYDMENWAWGKVHTLTLEHGLGDLDSRFNIGPYPRNGSNDTVDNAWFPFFERDFRSDGGPSLRMTVELTSGVEHAVNAIPGGQSSDPSSKHYKDQLVDYWLKHEAHPMLFTKKQIQENLEHTIALVPAE